jgi:hypothetical protein
MESNDVLAVIADDLRDLGFEVEEGKAKAGKLPRPVFFSDQGVYLRTYEIDAFEPANGIALEVEAGRATIGNAIYRDLIQASLMLDARFLVLAFRSSTATSREAGRRRSRAVPRRTRLSKPCMAAHA